MEFPSTTDALRIQNVHEVDSPTLVVYPERVRENVRRMIAYAGGTSRLRPHVKTHKMADVVRLTVAQGVKAFKVATIAEAEMVAAAGGEDVLWAYQPTGPKAERFARLVQSFPRVKWSTIADDLGAATALSQALSGAGVTAELLLDLDVGMGRTGIAPGEEAAHLYATISRLPGVRVGGLHVYDGQVRDPDIAKRTADCAAAFAPAKALQEELIGSGLNCSRLVCGGTPTFPIHARRADRECSPGTCTFWDASYESKFPDLSFVHAAVLVTRVISKPRGNRLCLDLGYKAVASDNPDPRARLLDLPDARTVNHSEEHLAVETAHAERYRVGDVIYAIPWHVCPTTALYPQVVVVEGGRAVGTWPVTARDRRITA